MLATVDRTRAVLVVVLMAMLLIWAQGSRPVLPATPSGPGLYPDTMLYHDVAARVGRGESYYHATTDLQRHHSFPTSPFVTVRLPTLAYISGALGPAGTQIALGVLLIAAAVAMGGLFADTFSLGEAAAQALAQLVGGAVVANQMLAGQHEVWGGVLLTLALALWLNRWWVPALLAAAAALAIRELALPFVGLAALVALIERKPGQFAGWAGVVVLFAILLAVHAREVAAAVLPGDPVSPGWSGMRGLGAAVRDLSEITLLHVLPSRLAGALAVLPLLGWLAAPPRMAGFVIALAGGYAVALALFARDQNFYWAMMLVPWWFAGYALVPRACWQLARPFRPRSAAA